MMFIWPQLYSLDLLQVWPFIVSDKYVFRSFVLRDVVILDVRNLYFSKCLPNGSSNICNIFPKYAVLRIKSGTDFAEAKQPSFVYKKICWGFLISLGFTYFVVKFLKFHLLLHHIIYRNNVAVCCPQPRILYCKDKLLNLASQRRTGLLGIQS